MEIIKITHKHAFLTLFLSLNFAHAGTIPNSKIVCAAGPTVNGVDVSHLQNAINWPSTASEKSFTFIKATEGLDYVDERFRASWPAAAGAGIRRSAYHFFHASDDPLAQAKFFVQTVGKLNDDDLPPTLDWEFPYLNRDKAVPAAVEVANARIWLNYVEAATGRTPIVYTGPSYIYQMGNPKGFERYPLYIADYPSKGEVPCPQIPLPWTNWSFWQFTKASGVAGIAGSTDLDFFNGVLGDLTTLILNSMPTVAPVVPIPAIDPNTVNISPADPGSVLPQS